MWQAKRNGILFITVILVFYLSIGGSASAATIYVDDDGSADYSTIQAAVNNSNSGDTIIVKPGTYTENIEISVDDLTIVSESGNPADTVVQSANSSAVFWVWTSGISIEGFCIKGSGDSDGIHLHYSAGDCHIKNNEITNLRYGIDISLFSIDDVIINNIISNCSEGISLSEGNSNTLSENEISNCEKGIVFWGSYSNKVNNNTISNCDTGIILSESTSEVVENNLITENNNGISLDYSDHITLTGNTIKSNKESGLKISGWYPEDSSSGIQIYNNYFSNIVNVDFENQPAIWNTTRSTGQNIIGGPYIGGNYWATPSGDGFSQTHSDADGDGIAEETYSLDDVNIDYLPLVVPVLPVAKFEANATSGDAPLSVLFTDLSQNSISRSWDVNNDGIEDSNEASFVYTYTSPGTYTVNLTVSNANGTVSKTETIDVEKKSSDGSSSESSSGGSSNGGTGGGSPESARNIEVKELSQVFITNGKTVQFDFAEEATCVVYVSFDSKKTAGKTTAIVEQLKAKSSLVSELPAGEVYKSFNVWIGNSGFASPENIENPVIGFKVEKSWLQNESIDKASITLNRYSEDKWEQLPADLTEEDETYLYFKAEVPGFSSFAITGKSKSSSGKDAIDSEPEQETRLAENEAMENIGEDVGQSAAEGENTKTPGFEVVYGIICLTATFMYKKD